MYLHAGERFFAQEGPVLCLVRSVQASSSLVWQVNLHGSGILYGDAGVSGFL